MRSQKPLSQGMFSSVSEKAETAFLVYGILDGFFHTVGKNIIRAFKREWMYKKKGVDLRRDQLFPDS